MQNKAGIGLHKTPQNIKLLGKEVKILGQVFFDFK
jgi:hypothetical protein